MEVSVCMATYNRAKYLKEQVLSILNQKFDDFSDVWLELIVSDDQSTDGTLDVLMSLNDERIKVISHKTRSYNWSCSPY